LRFLLIWLAIVSVLVHTRRGKRAIARHAGGVVAFGRSPSKNIEHVGVFWVFLKFKYTLKVYSMVVGKSCPDFDDSQTKKMMDGEGGQRGQRELVM
jgi:hypothetical protein